MRALGLFLCAGVWMNAASTLALDARGRESERASPVEKLSVELQRVHSASEEIQTTLEAERAAARETISSFARRRAEAQAQIAALQASVKSLRQASDVKASEHAERQLADLQLVPVVEKATAELRAAIENGIPFRLRTRLRACDHVIDTLHARGARPALLHLLQVLESERVMSETAGMARQTIALQGKEFLADVVHVGSVYLYFEAPGGILGFASREEGGHWTYKAFPHPEEREQVRVLFISLRRDVPTGRFVLPNTLSIAGGGQS